VRKKLNQKTKKPVKPQLTTIRRDDFGAFGDEGANDFDEDGDFDDDDFM